MLTFEDRAAEATLRLLLPDRFWSKAALSEGGCWLWRNGTTDFGHGLFWWDDKQWRVHRLVFSLLHGLLSESEMVCHSCDVPQCFRPGHLFLGNAGINVADMVAKGRQHRPIGDRHHNRKVDSATVVLARQRVAAGETGAAVARSLGIHPNTIYSILSRRNWGSVC